ncbi:hypothetical protein [Serratia fonticola]|uniref:hypothetical protein n=1 Tax=Serratia fonticola TaxID=47917 RepID=UPI003B003593
MKKASILTDFPVAPENGANTMKNLFFMTILVVLANVNGGEKPAMNILSGNNITVNVTNTK